MEKRIYKEKKFSSPIAGVISDTHIKVNNILQVVDIFQQFINLLIEFDLKLAIHCGDFFENRNAQTFENLIAIKLIINLFAENNITLFAIPGNHDKQNLEGEDSYVDIYDLHDEERFVIYKEAGYFDFTKTKLRLFFIPYFTEANTSDSNSVELNFSVPTTTFHRSAEIAWSVNF